jgi:UDP-4-amino-4,6-dideoxy-N-acetyl-beta-L-altrosamine N-acetyltransferase
MIELINFVDLSLDEKKMILSWRNHKEVKRWMYNTDDISIENHLKFIESLKNTKEKLYFLVKQDKEYIGVIDFTNITKNNCDFGLYSNINLTGIGKILLKNIRNYAFDVLKLKVLKAEVFKDNEKAIYLYKKFNFKETNKKIVNNKEVVCLDLKYENR